MAVQNKLKAHLFIAPGCPHCPNVLQVLSELIKEGDIAELEVSNMALVPEKAQALNIRSVPWTKIGPFELVGTQTKGELKVWIDRIQSNTGVQDYFSELLKDGELKKVIKLLRKEPELFKNLPPMIEDKEIPIGVKIGIGAIFEDFQGEKSIQTLIPMLTELLSSKNPNVRNDACYYLGLTESSTAIEAIQSLHDDETQEVRETVIDALDIIRISEKTGE
ncbi:MAG: HEAT repeat domain-containing protein [Gammaproteobacteria bacterium]|nr:HEAT repeat domain-containing protein [Gammaproteobacteria bacterium]